MPANVDYARFLDELRSSGVDVFDPSPKQLIPGEPPRFLRQDTHWTPEWMETVARDLADHLKSRVPSLRAATRSWSVEERQVSRVGDIVDMLKLPAGQRLYLPQTRIRPSGAGPARWPGVAAQRGGRRAAARR